MADWTVSVRAVPRAGRLVELKAVTKVVKMAASSAVMLVGCLAVMLVETQAASMVAVKVVGRVFV